MVKRYADDERFSPGLRDGEKYINGLKNDGRSVFIDGEKVDDVTVHPAFYQAARSIANLYDISSNPANRELMTFKSPNTDLPVNKIWMVPKSKEDLEERRAAIECWAEATFGLMGRTPDHVAGFFVGWAAGLDVFDRNINMRRSKNLLNFFNYLRDHDLFITYTIVPPQVDRSKPMHGQNPSDLYAGVIDECDDGVIIHGAQMLGTATALSDYLCLSQITPLKKGDENHAVNVVVACNAPGVRIYSRRSYAAAASSVYDYPLSSRFDETDSLVVFDKVFIPWEQVFVYKDLEICRDQWWDTGAHAFGNHQAQIRLCVKLKLLMGLAKRVVQMNGIENIPSVQTLLGDMASYAAMLEGLLDAQIATCTSNSDGVVEPGRQALYASIVLQTEAYPKMLDWIRELCGGGIIQLPSSAQDFLNPTIRADIDRYIQSPDYSGEERVKLMKLIWDLVGSEFAGRHEQYEKFYAGPPFVVKSRMYKEYDFEKSEYLVDSALSGYNLKGRL